MKLKITVHGVAYEVEVEVLDPGEGFAPAGPLPARAPALDWPPNAGRDENAGRKTGRPPCATS